MLHSHWGVVTLKSTHFMIKLNCSLGIQSNMTNNHSNYGQAKACSTPKHPPHLREIIWSSDCWNQMLRTVHENLHKVDEQTWCMILSQKQCIIENKQTNTTGGFSSGQYVASDWWWTSDDYSVLVSSLLFVNSPRCNKHLESFHSSETVFNLRKIVNMLDLDSLRNQGQRQLLQTFIKK